MVCACCYGYLPQAALQLFFTSVIILYSCHLVPPSYLKSRKVLRFFTIVIASVLLCLGAFLSALSWSPSLQAAFFAKLCTVLSKPGPLDAFRCPIVASVGPSVLELGPGAGANFRCLGNTSGIERYVTVEPNDRFTSALLAEAEAQSLPFVVTPTWLGGEVSLKKVHSC